MGLRAFAPLLESYVTTTEEPTQRTQLQVRAEESLDCARQLSLIFQKILRGITATEESAAVTFDRESKENEIEKAKKEKDVEYKIKEAEGLDRTLTELSSDKEGGQREREHQEGTYKGVET